MAIHKKFCQLNNPLVIIYLHGHKKIKGAMVGFMKEEESHQESPILRWHLVDEKEKMTLGVTEYGTKFGTIVETGDIKAIYFIEDNSVLQFD